MAALGQKQTFAPHQPMSALAAAMVIAVEAPLPRNFLAVSALDIA
jgi:hypothetical protein